MNDVTNPTTSFKTMALRQLPTVGALLINDRARDQLAAVAAKHMNPERLMRVVANAIRTTPGLQKCEPLSFLGALMRCSALGLEPNTEQGHCYLIPFNKSVKLPDGRWEKIPQVQLIIGYKGFKELARRTGLVASMHADVVYSDDIEFSHEYGSNQHLKHRPGPRLGKRLGAYFHIKLKDGAGEGHVYMTKEEIERIRNSAQGWVQAVKDGKTAQSPWTLHEDAMWAKTAVRRLAQNGDLPMSVEIMDAQATDERLMDYRGYALTKLEDLPHTDVMPDQDEQFIEDDVQQETVAEQPAKVEPPKADPKPRTPAKPREAVKKPDPVVAAAKPVEEQTGFDLGKTNADETDHRHVNQDTGEVIPDEQQEDEYADPVDEVKPPATSTVDSWLAESNWVRGVMADYSAMGWEAVKELHGEGIDALSDAHKAALMGVMPDYEA